MSNRKLKHYMYIFDINHVDGTLARYNNMWSTYEKWVFCKKISETRGTSEQNAEYEKVTLYQQGEEDSSQGEWCIEGGKEGEKKNAIRHFRWLRRVSTIAYCTRNDMLAYNYYFNRNRWAIRERSGDGVNQRGRVGKSFRSVAPNMYSRYYNTI
jgi:hypothetical protein